MVVNSMRLDKFLSKATELSRKESKKILHAGEVTVNDTVVKDPGLTGPAHAIRVSAAKHSLDMEIVL